MAQHKAFGVTPLSLASNQIKKIRFHAVASTVYKMGEWFALSTQGLLRRNLLSSHRMTPEDPPKVCFTRKEIRAFQAHAIIMAAVAGGIAVVAPSADARLLGVLLSVALVPVPPLAIYLVRKRR